MENKVKNLCCTLTLLSLPLLISKVFVIFKMKCKHGILQILLHFVSVCEYISGFPDFRWNVCRPPHHFFPCSFLGELCTGFGFNYLDSCVSSIVSAIRQICCLIDFASVEADATTLACGKSVNTSMLVEKIKMKCNLWMRPKRCCEPLKTCK